MATAWPTSNIVTTAMDAATDDPSVARGEIKLMADAVNAMMGQPPAGSGFNVQAGATYSLSTTDNGKVIVGEHATNITITLLAAGTAGAQFKHAVIAGGTGTVTFTGTISGLTNPVIKSGESCIIYCNGTVYEWIFSPAFHAPVTNYVSGRQVFIDDDIANHATQIDIDANLTVNTWESIGPTGSAATNIWTAMDDMPLTAQFVYLKINNSVTGSTTGNLYLSAIYLRVNGSSTANSADNNASIVKNTNRSGSSEIDNNVALAIIPVDSAGRFAAYWTSSGAGVTQIIDMWFQGWAE